MSRLRTAVVGVGAVGSHHARIYDELPQSKLVAVVDVDTSRASQVSKKHGCQFFTDYEELVGQVDAVSLAVPTVLHSEIGSALLAQGIHVLVEKPIADSLAGADRLVAAQRESGAVLHVGHSERFNPALTVLEKYITQPLFFEGHRLGVFVPRSLDVDVVLDLMIHDLDLVLGLVKQPLKEIRSAGVHVLTPRIDIANARLEFENGCVANLTASRVSSESIRKLRFFQPGQYLSMDFHKKETEVLGLQTREGTRRITHELLRGDGTEPLKSEIACFLASALEEQPADWPGPCTGVEAREALLTAHRVLEEMVQAGPVGL